MNFLQRINPPHILIYQMGKVGSDTIYQSLPVGSALHFHTLYNYNPNSKYLREKNSVNNFKQYLNSLLLRCGIRFSSKFQKIKIITLVRHPIERDISMFFQDLEGYINKYRKESTENYLALNQGGIEGLVKVFKHKYDFDYCAFWHERELQRFTGINIINKKLVNGIQRYEKGNFSVLCIDISNVENLTNVLEEFCELSVNLKKTNTASQKWYAPIYDEFKRFVQEDEEIKRKYQFNELMKWYLDS